MYVLNENELRAFRALCEGAGSVLEIQDNTNVSSISAYRTVKSLSLSRLVESKRNGKSIRLSPSHHGHSRALCSYLEGSRRPIDPLIGSRLLVLLSVSSNPKRVEKVAEEVMLSRETVRRIVWDLGKFGAVSHESKKVSIPRSDVALSRCLRDYSKGACEAALESIEPTGTVLWSEGIEFMFASRKAVKAPGVNETGITAMAKHGLQFVSDTRYYHFAYWKPKLRKEDIAIHQILVDPKSTPNISYSLLFLMKEGYSSAYLSKLGDALGIESLTKPINAFLRGENVENPDFPTRAEMAELRAQYEVE